MASIPMIDPNVKHVGVSKLRDLNATRLREDQETTLVIQDNDQPLAVLLSYEKYLIIQEQLASVMNTMEMFSEQVELEGVLAGLRQATDGQVRSFADVKAAMREKYGKSPKTEGAK